MFTIIMIGNLFAKRNTQPKDTANADPTANVNPVPSNQSQPSSPQMLNTQMTPQARQDFSILTHLDTKASQTLTQAEKETKRIQNAMIEPDQILIGLLFDGEIFKLLED